MISEPGAWCDHLMLDACSIASRELDRQGRARQGGNPVLQNLSAGSIARRRPCRASSPMTPATNAAGFLYPEMLHNPCAISGDS